MSEVRDFKDNLLFDIQKAFWDERGRGARYRLTMIGVDFLKSEFEEGNRDIKTLKKWLVDNKFCKEIEHDEDDISLTVSVKDCCLLNTRKKFQENNLEILGCPIANMIMYLVEEKTGSSPELLPVKADESSCKFTMAKMGTAEVVDEV